MEINRRINNPSRVLACKVHTTVVTYEHNIASGCNCRCSLFLFFLSLFISIVRFISLWELAFSSIMSHFATVVALHTPLRP
ncbi:hypothetical protein BT93_J0849 [Corymbia citriodora subsp. variegata]|nr:hypothetical protein BT93_J0849 [Corymbia citriodora subsp. variegata]